MTRRDVFFSSLFFSLDFQQVVEWAGGRVGVWAGFQNDISVKCKNTAAANHQQQTDPPRVSATYDTVNNLHYKAHS